MADKYPVFYKRAGYFITDEQVITDPCNHKEVAWQLDSRER